MYLAELEEKRARVADRITEHQNQVKIFFNKKSKKRNFYVRDLILLWDKRREPKGMHRKFDSLWRGPFKIKQLNGKNSFYLSYPDGTGLLLPYSGKHLKIFRK